MVEILKTMNKDIINQDLYTVYKIDATSLELLHNTEVKELAKSLLANKKPTKDILLE